jgi:hypothetical protein
MRDPDACVVLGKRKQSRQVRGAHASIAGQHHTSGKQEHISYTTLRAASQSLISCRNMRDPDACVVLCVRKQSRQVREAHASIAGQPSAHIWATRAHNQHHMVGSKPITHPLQNQAGSIRMCGVGQKKTKQASLRGTCQHSRPAISTHLGNEGTNHTPHGGQQADHSRPAESGGIQMHVWGRAKENDMQVRGAHASMACQPLAHIWATRAHNTHHMAGSKPIAHRLQNQEGSR